MVGEGELCHDDGMLYVAVLTILPSSSVTSTWDTWRGLSALMFGLVDGEAVVAAVEAVTTEANDVVVDPDVVEVLDTAVWADVAEDTDLFFLALSD